MQIKKFKAGTLKDAISLMKAELGESALVLSTKIVDDEEENKRFELTAGIEDGNESYEEKPRPKKVAKEQTDFENELKKLTNKIYGQQEKKTTVSVEANKKKINQYFKAEKTTAKSEIRDLLVQREIEEPIIETILNQLKKHKELVKEDDIDSYIISAIESMIPTSGFQYDKKKKPKVISLVGPTGVGKTTCIAKLAVISKILHNLDIGLISIDTYRLGALDQLKILAEVSNIDFLVAYEPSDMPKLMAKFRKKDIVFIDTVGRSQKNAALLKGINDFLKAVNVDEIYLVQSSTTTLKTMTDIAEKFKVLNYDGVIFTKIDEAAAYGNILNLVYKYNVPVKYLTNGQVIPDDIIAADSEFISKMIYSGNFDQ